MKAQTTMIAVTIGIVMLVFILIFLLSISLGSQSGQTLKSEYRNIFAHSLLLSLLRTDTSCGIYSDALKAAYFGGGRCDAKKFFDTATPAFMQDLLNATGQTSYEWYFEAEPKSFRRDAVAGDAFREGCE